MSTDIFSYLLAVKFIWSVFVVVNPPENYRKGKKVQTHVFYLFYFFYVFIISNNPCLGASKTFSGFSGVSKCKLVQKRRKIHLQVPKCKTYIPTHIPCTTKNTNSKEGMNSKLKYMIGKTRTLLNFKENWETPLYFGGHIRKICCLVLKLCIFPKVKKILIFHMDICLPPNSNPLLYYVLGTLKIPYCFKSSTLWGVVWMLCIVQTQGASFLTRENWKN